MKKYCIICKKELEKGKRSKKQFEKQKYCSRKCFSDDKRITETIECELCGTIKTRKKRSDSKSRFCSRECSIKSAGVELLKIRDYNGDKNPAWKNGKTITTQGYIRLNTKERINEHRYVMEQYIGRKLKSEEVVHHIDCDKTNNNIKNLKLCKNQSEHLSYHKRNGLGQLVKIEK